MRSFIFASLVLVLSACAASYLPDNFRLISDSSVFVGNGGGHGSGTIIGPHRVLTAAHVAEHGNLVVTLADGTTRKAALLWKSEKEDAAILKLEGASVRGAATLDCDPVEVGEPLAWVGNPLQMTRVYNSGFASGQITTVYLGQQLVPVSALFNPGDSGSGLFSPDGRVRGVVSAFAVTQLGFMGASQSGIGLMTPTSVFCDEMKAGLK